MVNPIVEGRQSTLSGDANIAHISRPNLFSRQWRLADATVYGNASARIRTIFHEMQQQSVRNIGNQAVNPPVPPIA